ncbi:CobW family GTP-binding protein [Aestuariivirga sp.]|jgi:G3E family GTPase|uniref:CobW family GTP-binding protein n=1 Tax=Aestuariivirga sp. TaxID=2650926 RepID=UPI003784D0D3
MNGPEEGRIRLTVLGGYLGSGKTTWLRHQLHEGQFARARVIVNEAAETPVDHALLGQASGLCVLAGGCVCCVAKAELISVLRKLCDERTRADAAGQRLDHIVLETSGLADPGPIVAAIKSDPVLVYHIVVSEIIVAADARHAMSQLRSEPLGRRQIEIADRIIVTKVDEAEPAELTKLLSTLVSINPAARISGAVKGVETALPSFEGVAPDALPDLNGQALKPPVAPTRLQLDDSIDWTAFTIWLSALLHARGDDIVRVKGVVRTPAGRLLLQTVRKVVQTPEILPEQDGLGEDNMIVLIGRGFTQSQLARSLRYFAGKR